MDYNFPGQNTGVGSLSLLQRIFPAQGLNPGLLCCRWILHQLSHQGAHFGGRKHKVSTKSAPSTPPSAQRAPRGKHRGASDLSSSSPRARCPALGSAVQRQWPTTVLASSLLSSSGEPGVPAASCLPVVLPSPREEKGVQGQTQDLAHAAGGPPPGLWPVIRTTGHALPRPLANLGGTQAPDSLICPDRPAHSSFLLWTPALRVSQI